jgi:quinol-cytochrome oxidoreductase complex cytochrome b subunit
MRKIRTWLNDRLGLDALSGFGMKKEVPLHSHTIWYYTGSSTLLFLGIQIVTGVMLALYYNPTIKEANASVARIMKEIPLGWIIRSIHSWSATLMIATVLIHLLSIAFTKAYRAPREATWMTGVLLLAASLAFGFTGYLLPWDDLSLAATKVGTDIPKAIPIVGAWVTSLLRGGEDVTGDTISRFFIVHVCVLPLAICAILGVHLFLVQKHGMSLPLKAESRGEKLGSLPFWPNFLLREAGVWLVLLGALLTVAVFLAPSLGPAANLMAPAPPGIKPEWYFLFMFQTLKLFPAHILGINGELVALAVMAAGLLLVLILPFLDNRPAERKGRVITWVVYTTFAYTIAMTVWSLL